MKNITILSFILTYALFSQPNNQLFLRVAVPETDSIKTSLSRYRIGASTLPSAKAYINGKEVKVYPSGAFVGLVDTPPETTMVNILVRSAEGDSLQKNIIFFREKPLQTSPTEPIVIDTNLIEPSQDIWLGKDDILEVKCKASPGQIMTFSIEDIASDIPMQELKSSTNGVQGIYIGRYKVKEDDRTVNVPIQFKIKKGFWSSVKAFSKGRVSMLPNEFPRTAEVIGKRPYLNVGLGNDRLGGAKLGYIESGVKVAIAGKVGSLYKIKLSADMESWLPEEFVRDLSLETPLPYSLVGSISVTGNKTEDIVRIALDQKLPYISEQLINPSAIVLNIFGATSNTNWVTHHLSAEGIEQVKWNQVAEDHYQLTIFLKQQQHWGYYVGYEENMLKVIIRRTPTIKNSESILDNLKIVVDAGHGGENRGAIGATGALEKDITLAIAKILNSQLKKKGVETFMTRESDVNIGMSARIDKIFAFNPHLLVSIHCNSIGEASDPEMTQGTSTYYRYPGFEPLAEIMYKKMLELGLVQYGKTGGFNFSLNAPTQMPNVLVETAFISNPEDEMKLLDEDFQKKVADKIVEGLEEFVKLKTKEEGKRMN